MSDLHWNGQVGFTPREGPVIYPVAYIDDSRGRRPVACSLSFVEMAVPYGDPNDPHYRKNAFDAGKDGLGKTAHSLKKLCQFFSDFRFSCQGSDYLGYIKYFDTHFTNFAGGVETTENCVCLHGENHGILWKHQDWRKGLAEVRRSRRLTVSFICTVANYEYAFFWHLYQFRSFEPGENRKHGTTIAPGLYAPIHQHFCVARMAMANRLQTGEAFNQVKSCYHPVFLVPISSIIHAKMYLHSYRLSRSGTLTTLTWTGQLTGFKLERLDSPRNGASHYTPTLAVRLRKGNMSPPAIDIPPSASDLELKDDIATKLIQNGMITKL
ncbi:hypothetical protein V6N13_105619 [Hibiscus sabdariffa]